ncbi:MAG TPA: hypothetical protein VME17_02260 [Bryobacteraceae bacterium]|nr:hypothetical protein [Bryobacteraceae bacterium]
MIRNNIIFNLAISAGLCLPLCMPVTAAVDLEGSWQAKNHENAMERGPGPNIDDWTGLPLNASGRAKSLSYMQSIISMPERTCWFYTQWHIADGPFGLRIWAENDKITGKTIAWVVGAWEDRADMTIWMDGRPHPSKNAPHLETGFTTGVWHGDVLTAYTTHMKSGYLRRNGAPTSDEATLTTTFFRHGDMLVLTLVEEDPVYLSEPFVLTRTYDLTPRPISPGGPPCIIGFEGVKEGRVPHYLPGKNPFVGEMDRIYHIPPEASLGGAETMYPAFRDKLKANFTIPPKCTRDCGVPTPAPAK